MCIDELRTAFSNLENILLEFNKDNFESELEGLGMKLKTTDTSDLKNHLDSKECGLCIVYNTKKCGKKNINCVSSLKELKYNLKNNDLDLSNLSIKIYTFKNDDSINNLILNSVISRLKNLFISGIK